jgi:hypothetical protein
MMHSGRRIVLNCLLVVFSLIAIAQGSAAAKAQDPVAERKIRRMERFVYGEQKTGEMAERLEALSKDLLGRNTSHRDDEKLSRLFEFLFTGTQKAPSLETKVNFLEWKTFHELRQGKIGERLTSLEKVVLGETSSEPLAFRVEQLVHMSIENGIIAMHSVKVPKGTALKVKLEKTLSSKHSKTGEGFFVSILQDLILEQNVLVVAKGGYAYGEIEQVKRPRRFGRSGLIRMRVNDVGAIDSTSIPVAIEGPGETFDRKKLGMAAGASALGYLALGGPVGLVGGIFVKGRDAQIPAGMELTVITLEECYVSGIVINRP